MYGLISTEANTDKKIYSQGFLRIGIQIVLGGKDGSFYIQLW
jgi:hypothetical protein